MESEKTGIGLKQILSFMKGFNPFFENAEFPMGLINLFFVLPSTSFSMLAFTNQRIIQESGWMQFFRMIYHSDDRLYRFLSGMR